MREWFYKLAPRERLLVGTAAVLTGILLIVTLGIRPIVSKTTRGHEHIEDKRKLLSEVERVAERIGPQTGSNRGTPGIAGQSLVVIVDRTTRSSGLAPYLKRNQPDGANSIRLRFENAPFDATIEWLSSIKSGYGLIVSAANIEAANTTGRVNCNLTLTRGGG